MICENHEVVAEFNIVRLGKHYSNDQLPPSMKDELAIATYAIKKVKGINVKVTGMSIQIKSKSIRDILKAIEYAHLSLKDVGISRIVSSICIDERFDKSETAGGRELVKYENS